MCDNSVTYFGHDGLNFRVDRNLKKNIEKIERKIKSLEFIGINNIGEPIESIEPIDYH